MKTRVSEGEKCAQNKVVILKWGDQRRAPRKTAFLLLSFLCLPALAAFHILDFVMSPPVWL